MLIKHTKLSYGEIEDIIIGEDNLLALKDVSVPHLQVNMSNDLSSFTIRYIKNWEQR